MSLNEYAVNLALSQLRDRITHLELECGLQRDELSAMQTKVYGPSRYAGPAGIAVERIKKAIAKTRETYPYYLSECAVNIIEHELGLNKENK